MKKLLLSAIFITTVATYSTASAEQSPTWTDITAYANTQKDNVSSFLATVDGWLTTAEQYPMLQPYATKLRAKIQEYRSNPQAGISELQSMWKNKTTGTTPAVTPTPNEILDQYEVGP